MKFQLVEGSRAEISYRLSLYIDEHMDSLTNGKLTTVDVDDSVLFAVYMTPKICENVRPNCFKCDKTS